MRIWVHLNGIQQGPYEFEELKQLPINEDTPVWYEGLPAWTPAGQAPATISLFGQGEQADTVLAEQTQTAQQHEYTQTSASAAAEQANNALDIPEMPKRFFAWSIILTVIFCSPLSILGIISGILTTVQYNSGNYVGAQKMSNITEWLVILSITFGFAALPLFMLLFV